ncbi:protein SEC13 homolog [Hyalella azteca]|uniref:Protein SEC13 homolog n=1 Tax=Hyalella azteca TaxID=294128 RepID=A0A8B7PF26_HYAAZ|nr:protein SEC13 homolog [Hyalella azteca]
MVSIVSQVETGHEDMIHDAQMDYYGTRLATCSSDRTVRVFEVRKGEQSLVASLREHEGPVWQVAWAHPMYGRLLASCGYDRKLIIWQEDQSTWRSIYTYTEHTSSINSVCWAPHELGLMLACASSDGSVSVLTYTAAHTWHAVKITNAHNVGCNAVSWAPAVSSGGLTQQRLVTGGCDSYVKIWRYESGEWVEEAKLEGHSDWVRDVAWAPSCGLGTSVIASCSQDCRVLIWTGDNGQFRSKELPSFADVIWHVSWSVTGNILAVSGGDNRVSLWKENTEGQWVCLSDSSKAAEAAAITASAAAGEQQMRPQTVH